jgi:hypothetical protein
MLYIASDGQENASRMTVDAIQSKILASGVRVFFSFPLRNTSLFQPNRELPNTKLDLMDLVTASGGDFMHVTPEGLVLSFQIRPKLPVLEGTRLFFEGLFENEVLRVVASPDSKKRKLAIARASSSTAAPRIQFTYPHELYFCSQRSL